jgi:hypothetical protein
MSHKLAVNPLSLRPYASLGRLAFRCGPIGSILIPVIDAGRSKPGRLTPECDQRRRQSMVDIGFVSRRSQFGRYKPNRSPAISLLIVVQSVLPS